MQVRGNVEPLQRLPFCKANDGPRPSRRTCHFAGRIHSLREIGSTSCETTFPRHRSARRRVRGSVEPLQRLSFCAANDGPRPSRQTCHFAGRIHSLREIGSTSCETTFPLRQPTGKLKFQLLIQEPITKIRMLGIICQHQKDNKNTTAYKARYGLYAVFVYLIAYCFKIYMQFNYAIYLTNCIFYGILYADTEE